MLENIMPKYIILAVIILVVLLILWKNNVFKKPSNKKKTEKKTKKKKKSESENESANLEKAEDLYELVHEKMSDGMNLEEFKSLVGKTADSVIFLELKQKYNLVRENEQDPRKTIKVRDYVNILDKIPEEE